MAMHASLPTGLIPTATVLSSSTFNSITHSGSLQFSPLRQSHTGNYTCRLGAGTLVAHTILIANVPPIIVMVTANFSVPLMVGQTSYRHSLTCNVSGTDILNPTIAYHWTRNYGNASTQVGTNLSILSLSPLRLSDAGSYSCTVSATSIILNNPVIANNSQNVIIQIPDPQSVTIASSPGTTVLDGTDVTLTCSIQMNHNVLASELSLLIVNVSLTRPDGSVFELSNPMISGTNFTYTTVLSSFGKSDTGNYSCTATIRPQQATSIFEFLTGTGLLSNTTTITIGKRLLPESCEAITGIAVGTLILVEGIIAGVTGIIVVLCRLMIRQRKDYKNKFAVTANVAYGEVKLDSLGDVGGEYEDPDRLAISRQCGGGNYEPTRYPAL